MTIEDYSGIVYLNEDQFTLLKLNGQLEVNGTIIKYSPNSTAYAVKDNRSILIPKDIPEKTQIVAVDNNGKQTMLNVGEGLKIENNNLKSLGTQILEMTGTFNEIRDKVFELQPKYIDVKSSSIIKISCVTNTLTTNSEGNINNSVIGSSDKVMLYSHYYTRFYRADKGIQYSNITYVNVTDETYINGIMLNKALEFHDTSVMGTILPSTYINPVNRTTILYDAGYKDMRSDIGTVILYY